MINKKRRPHPLFFFRKKNLRATSDSIIDMFVPDDLLQKEFSDDPQKLNQIKEEIQKSKSTIFQEIVSIVEVRYLLTTLSNLHLLYQPWVIRLFYKHVSKEDLSEIDEKHIEPIKNYIKKHRKRAFVTAFYDLGEKEQLELLELLQASKINIYRRVAFSIRTLYMAKVYRDKVSELISGITVDTVRHSEKPQERKKILPQIRYNKSARRIEGELDYIIIGSGAAGSVIASELQKAGKKVLILEKGPFVVPGERNVRDDMQFMENKGLRSDNNGSVFFMNGEVVGGGSSVNIDMSYPPTLPYIQVNFEKWREEKRIPEDVWTKEAIHDAYNWVKNTFQPRTIAEEEINRNNRILQKTAIAAGLNPKKYDLLTHKKGENPYQITDKKSVVETLLYPAFYDEKNPTGIIDCANVHNIIIENGKAQGVTFSITEQKDTKGLFMDPMQLKLPKNKKITVRAKNVIVSAGALGSAVLLLKSNINNSNIGKGIVAHPFLPIVGYFKEDVDVTKGTPSTVYLDDYLTTDENHKKPNFLIEASPGNAEAAGVIVPGTPQQILENIKNLKKVAAAGLILVEDMQLKNRIELNRAGEVQIFHELSEKDKKRFAFGMAELARLYLKAGAEKVTTVSCEAFIKPRENGEFTFIKTLEDCDLLEKNMRFIPNKTLLMAAHLMGSCKLGTSPENSVVDRNHQVWGVENLYVADGSVFPKSVGANPMQSIYTIAKIFVDKHLELEMLRNNKAARPSPLKIVTS